MQMLGIALISIGLWISYCAVYGLSPLETAKAVIQSPAQFRQIIADAKAATAEEYAALINSLKSSSGGIAGREGVNPFTAFQISDDWDEHVSRGSSGGTDYMMPSGTPLPTPFGGIISNTPNNGSGGHTVTVRMDNGYALQYMHLSAFKKRDGERVKAGDIVGLSGGARGAVGAGSSTGPHLHVHVVTPAGTRMSFLDYILGG